MFRLPAYQAVINRLGFNNLGIDALVRNVEKSSYRGVLGINIGKNRATPNDKAFQDYQFCMQRAYALASYLTINISSPNTVGLRDLQEAQTLRRFIGQLREEQERLAGKHGQRRPMLLKIAPDLDDAQMDAMGSVLAEARVDGLICTNTTLDRSGVKGARHAAETGGLSGRPLCEPALRVLDGMRQRLGDGVPIIGVGGILDGADATERISHGASLVQIYTGLIYRGPDLLRECVEEIRRHHGDQEA
jgi:dihydroorotate dehydrogenase